MTKEERDLLLRDLCARLPYYVKVEYRGANVDLTRYARSIKIENCKPYLRPMSSITKDEQEEFFDLIICVDNGKAVIEEDKIDAYNNFIYSHHLDNKNFIEKGLAIEAPEGMYNMI